MAAVLGERNMNVSAAAQAGKAGGKKTVEEIYQKKTQLEHILLRPDTYIGSVEKIAQPMLVVGQDSAGEPCFVQRSISFVPGLFKIFDEIIVNAADHKIRDPDMDTIKITIDKETGTISVFNNGKGIPIVMHAKEQVYVPELIFGHLLTSSNYDDVEKKVTGGRNGYGAKLCNIFSTEFVVETADKDTGLKFRQVFRDNMGYRSEPKIEKAKSGEEWTKITFRPDLAKFGMVELEDDILSLMARRAYDVAGTTKGVRVFLNGQRLPIKSFKDYVDFCLKSRDATMAGTPTVHEVINDRWEVAMTLSDTGFQQTSFVNSIAAYKGGTHVTCVVDQVVEKLMEAVNKKSKAAPVKGFQVKNHLSVFINCLVENPTFDSQTKENMTLKPKSFGSDYSLSEKFIKSMMKSGVVEAIIAMAQTRSQAQLAKASGSGKQVRINGIPKLDDANEAGTRNSHLCTLILTEGDSAKALAVSGLSVVGRDYFGVFPLRGKLLNVREASHKQILENAEIKSIVQIMGLQYGKVYEDARSLRYGKLMIMADQDQDGSHIKGLLINFIHHFWPSLLKVPGFLVEFITPIVKCSKGSKEISFFTLPQYQAWSQAENTKGWKIKYYKGLGTSTPKEAKEYFANIQQHRVPFSYVDEHDDHGIELAFSKKKVDDRKEWLRGFVPGTFLDHGQESVRYSDFIHKELIFFSMADNVRSIPSVVDGFKPGQRKVLYSCLKRKLKEEIKVAQLAGYVAEHSSYHHGEVSLAGTIINMAQDYVGSNNINLLLPIGQFGTRLQGGKDAASPRYVFTKLSELTRLLFVADDDALLTYLNDDGISIEPEYYVPILPMVLVNGSEGIGTGWSSYTPTYNPVDIVANIKRLVNAEPCVPMQPFFRGFAGEVLEKSKDKFVVRGKYEQVDDHTIRITELPVGVWTQSYKESLEGMLVATEKTPASIKDYKEHHTDTTVSFTVTMTEEQMREAQAAGIDKKFKLESSISTSNMVLFDPSGRIKKYESPEEILEEFYSLRLTFYQKRKEHLANKLTEDYERLDNKVRFIQSVINGTLVVSNRKRDELLVELKKRGFKAFPKTATPGKSSASAEGEEEEAEGGAAAGAGAVGDYDYLLSMPIWNLTAEKVAKVSAERDEREAELTTLLGKRPTDLWIEDLDRFLEGLRVTQEEEAANAAESLRITGKGGKGKKGAVGGKRRAKAGDDEEEEDDEDAEDWKPSKAKKAPAPKKAAPVAKTNVQTDIRTAFSSIGSAAAATTTTKAATSTITAAAAAPAGAPVITKAPAASKTSAPATKAVSSAGATAVAAAPAHVAAPVKRDLEVSSPVAARPAKVPRKAAPKKLVISSDTEEEIDLGDDSNESVGEVQRHKPAAEPKGRKTARHSDESDNSDGDFDLEEVSEDDWAPTPAKPTKKTAARNFGAVKETKTATTTAAATAGDAKKKAPLSFATTTTTAAAPAPAAAKKKKAAALVLSEDDDAMVDYNMDTENPTFGSKTTTTISKAAPAPKPVTKPAAAPKASAKTTTKAPTTAATATSSTARTGVSGGAAGAMSSAASEAAPPPARKKAAAKPKPAKKVVSDEEEDSADEAPISRNAAPSRSKRAAAAAVKYVFSDEEEGGDALLDSDDE